MNKKFASVKLKGGSAKFRLRRSAQKRIELMEKYIEENGMNLRTAQNFCCRTSGKRLQG
jgi:hypothetical protein